MSKKKPVGVKLMATEHALAMADKRAELAEQEAERACEEREKLRALLQDEEKRSVDAVNQTFQLTHERDILRSALIIMCQNKR